MKKLTKLLILIVLIIIAGIYVFHGLLDMNSINNKRNTLSFAQESIDEINKLWSLDYIDKEELLEWEISEIGWQGDKDAYYVLDKEVELVDFKTDKNEDVEDIFKNFYSQYDVDNKIDFEEDYRYLLYLRENDPNHHLCVVYQEGYIYLLERVS